MSSHIWFYSDWSLNRFRMVQTSKYISYELGNKYLQIIEIDSRVYICVWQGVKHLSIFIYNRYYIEGILKHMFNLKFPNLNLDNSSARPFLFDRLYLHNFNFLKQLDWFCWLCDLFVRLIIFILTTKAIGGNWLQFRV